MCAFTFSIAVQYGADSEIIPRDFNGNANGPLAPRSISSSARKDRELVR